MHILTVEITDTGGVRFAVSEGLDDGTALRALALVEDALRDRIAEARVRAQMENETETDEDLG